jgi:hypothetical protein
MSNCGCAAFTIVEGDTLPVLKDTLAQDGVVPEGLDGATIKFVAVHRVYRVRIEKTPTLSDAALGYVDTSFAASDLQAGEYDYRYEVTIGAAKLSFPNTGTLPMLVLPRL